MQKAIWYKWHSLFGLKLAMLLCFILVTGTLAVISHELDWLFNPAIRANSAEQSNQVAWLNIYNNAKVNAEHASVEWIAAPEHQGFAAMVVLRSDNGHRSRMYFDPQSGEFQGVGDWFNIQTALRRIHRHLMLPLPVGITIVASTSFLFLGSLVSGLVMQRNWWKTLWRKPRSNNAKVFWGDVHRTSGLWSSWLLLVMVITGFWYLAEQWGARASYPDNAEPTSVIALNNAVQPTAIVLHKILAQIETSSHSFEMRSIQFPRKAGQPLIIEGRSDHTLVRNRANNRAFDPVSGELLSVRHADELSFHARISEAADPLHFGTWGGFASKILYFLFGVLLSSLSITGTYIFAMRMHRTARNEKPMIRQRWCSAWQNLGWPKWLALIAVLVCLSLLIYQLA